MLGLLFETLKKAWWPGSLGKPDAKDEPPPPQPPWYDDSQASAAAYGAAVAHVINRPDGIRARAQVSATISAAVAAALAAFAPLIGLGQRERWLQVLVTLAVLSWLVSLWRYIRVIAYSFHDYEQELARAAAQERVGNAVEAPDGKTGTEPAGEAAEAPDGKAATEPDGKAATEPDGKAATEPDGKAATEPDGEAAEGPAGEAAEAPDGKAATEPDGKAATEPDGKAASDASVTTEQHLRRFIQYAAHIRARVERGTAATQVALALTLTAAAALAAEAMIAGPTKTVRVWLNPQGVVAVGRVCTTAIDAAVQAKARPSDLSLSVVPLHFEPDECEDENAVGHVSRQFIDAARWPDAED